MRIVPIIAFAAALVLTPSIAWAQGNSMRPDNAGTGASPDRASPERSGNAEGRGRADPPGSSSGSDNPGNRPPNASNNAAGGTGNSSQSSQDRAAQAVSGGQAVPLDRVLRPALEDKGGTLIDTGLFTVDGFLLYELKILRPDGTLETLYYYARTGNPVR